LCNGAQYARSDYAILFGVIGLGFTVTDDGATFNVPDLRGRTPIGAGQGGGLTNRTLGAKGGEENHALSTVEMPSHSHGGATGNDTPDHVHYVSGNTGVDSPDHAHTVGWSTFNSSCTTGPAGFLSITGGAVGTTGASARHAHGFSANSGGASARHAHGINAEGGSGGHNNMPPYAAVNWYIKT
jgi:microcystin-dependent protein